MKTTINYFQVNSTNAIVKQVSEEYKNNHNMPATISIQCEVIYHTIEEDIGSLFEFSYQELTAINMDLEAQIVRFAIEEYGYEPTEDIKRLNQYRIDKEELDEYDTKVWNFKYNVDLKRCLNNNLDYKILTNVIYSSFEEPGEELNYMLQTEIYNALDYMDISKIKEVLLNLTPEMVEEIKDSFMYRKNETQFLKDLFYIAFFELNILPDVYSILSFEYCRCNEPYGATLDKKDYSFPELELIFQLVELFDTDILSNDFLIEVLLEDYYDYSTYSIGGYNADMRDESNIYFSDFLIPFLKKFKSTNKGL